MGLFGHKEPAPAVQPAPAPAKTGFFGRRASSPSPPRTSTTTAPKRHSTLLHKDPEDHSITTARNSLVQAEAAEREADRALFAAKAAVRAARDQLKRLELEAAEEARLAKIKQSQAKAMSKRGKGLGRHEHV